MLEPTLVGVTDLILRARNEVPPHHDRLVKRRAAQQQRRRLVGSRQGDGVATASEVGEVTGLNDLGVGLKHAARDDEGVLEVRPQFHDAVTSVKAKLKTHEVAVTSSRRALVAMLTDEDGAIAVANPEPGQLFVMLEGRSCVASCLGERYPELHAVQFTRGDAGILLRVRDTLARGHEVQLAGRDQLLAAQAVSMDNRPVVEPRHGLQPNVRMRRDVKTILKTKRRGSNVVDETPRADGPSSACRQGPSHARLTNEGRTRLGEQNAWHIGLGRVDSSHRPIISATPHERQTALKTIQNSFAGVGIVDHVRWPEAEVLVDEALMRTLLAEQFPEMTDLPVRRLGEGFDNHLFQLGDHLVARLPRRARGIEPLENELRFLAVAASHVTLLTPLPLLAGSPSPSYPWPWMIASFIEGVSGDEVDDDALLGSASALASFLGELHTRAPDDAPSNPWRSVPLAQRAHDLDTRLDELRDVIDTERASALFARACAVPLGDAPMTWLHGDLHPGNLVFRDRHLVGVVDFGDLCAGDPATDLAGGLLALPYDALETFFAEYGVVDDEMLARTIGWAIVFATIMIGLGRSSRPRYTRVGRLALENATRLSASLSDW